jgi:formylglycine-generating enzyme required for sulfatase activity
MGCSEKVVQPILKDNPANTLDDGWYHISGSLWSSPMNPAVPLLTTILVTSLAVGHAAEPLTNSIGMPLVRIEPGTFTMGQDGPPLEDYMGQKRLGEMYKDIDRIDFDEKPSHKVTITHPFLMGVTEVTVEQYRQFDPGFKTSDAKSNPADDDAASGIPRINALPPSPKN